MPARNHHSIGEVLSLLQDDFPDITISKIRFLESQGLISPERTPSGYRRFFERDLQRLRWILTQQRDHYLPLKVIREKIAAGEADDAASGDARTAAADTADAADAGEAAEPAAAEPAGETTPPASPQATATVDEYAAPATALPVDEGDVAEEAPAGGGAAGGPEGERPVAVPGDAELGGEGLFAAGGPLGDAEPSVVGDTVEVFEASEAVGASEPGEPGPAEAEALDTAIAAEAAGDETAADQGDAATTGPRRSGGRSKPRRSASGKGKAGSAQAPTADAVPAEAGEAGDSSQEAAGPDDDDGPDRGGQGERAAAKADQPTVIALTRDELAEASGCPVPVLNDLERFGLLLGKTVGRGVLYDGDALVVARLAARFANHGLEPRHLRSFRLAAEREIGLFAQVVGPLLQRRDAMAHERAMETLSDLAELASELHEVLVQNLVSREFGNR